MAAQGLRSLEIIGKRIARALEATVIPAQNGFIVEKRNKKKNIYIRIQFARNIITEQTDIVIERGMLSDKKPYVREILKDTDNLNMTIPEEKEEVPIKTVTFLHTHGDRFSVVNVDTNLDMSRICAFDRRKFMKNKEVPKEVAEMRRKFSKIL